MADNNVSSPADIEMTQMPETETSLVHHGHNATLCNNVKDGKPCTRKLDGAKDCLGLGDGLCKECRSEQNWFVHLLTKLSSEDMSQFLSSVITFLFQLYQMVIGSLLIIFTPQLCAENICTYHQNVTEIDFPFYGWALAFNFCTMISFFFMYVIEYQREFALIALMDVDGEVNNDGVDVAKRMELLSDYERTKLQTLNKRYQWAFYISGLWYVLNLVCSAIIVARYTAGNQTATTFVTNVLFMVKKVLDVKTTTGQPDHVYFSAYLMSKVQFNQVDPIIQLRKSGKEVTPQLSLSKHAKLNAKSFKSGK